MKKVINIIDNENNYGKYEVFFTFESDLTKKSYVIYTDYCEDEDGTLVLNAGSYIEEPGGLRVNKNLTHEEHEMISEIMNSLINQAKKREENKEN